MSKKLIIVFEGIEGTGKSHHIKKVANYLTRKRIRFIQIRSISNYVEKNKARAINRRVEIYLDAFLKQKVQSEIEINL